MTQETLEAQAWRVYCSITRITDPRAYTASDVVWMAGPVARAWGAALCYAYDVGKGDAEAQRPTSPAESEMAGLRDTVAHLKEELRRSKEELKKSRREATLLSSGGRPGVRDPLFETSTELDALLGLVVKENTVLHNMLARSQRMPAKESKPVSSIRKYLGPAVSSIHFGMYRSLTVDDIFHLAAAYETPTDLLLENKEQRETVEAIIEFLPDLPFQAPLGRKQGRNKPADYYRDVKFAEIDSGAS